MGNNQPHLEILNFFFFYHLYWTKKTAPIRFAHATVPQRLLHDISQCQRSRGRTLVLFLFASALTTAPAISRNSRHIAHYAHLLRHLYKTGGMVPAYLGTHEIIPNGLTKTLGPIDYIYHEHQLFGAFRSSDRNSLFRS